MIFFGVIGAFRHAAGAERTAQVLWAIGGLGIVGILLPRFMRYVYLAWMVVVFPIGWLVSNLLLTMVFCLVVTPLGLVMRLTGRDPMRRALDPDRSSYWEKRPSPPEARAYFKQF